jgi:hypothetical protein
VIQAITFLVALGFATASNLIEDERVAPGAASGSFWQCERIQFTVLTELQISRQCEVERYRALYPDTSDKGTWVDLNGAKYPFREHHAFTYLADQRIPIRIRTMELLSDVPGLKKQLECSIASDNSILEAAIHTELTKPRPSKRTQKLAISDGKLPYLETFDAHHTEYGECKP